MAPTCDGDGPSASAPHGGLKGTLRGSLRSASRWGCAPTLDPAPVRRPLAAMDPMPRCGPYGARHPILERRGHMAERAVFGERIILSREEAFDVVARCDEVVGHAEAIGEMSIAFAVDSIRQLVLGRLMGVSGGPDD